MNLDEVDYRILLALQQDSRLSTKDVAKQANVSIPTARSRIKQLIKLGVIKHFTTIIDHQKLLGGVTVFINLKSRLTDLKNVGEEIRKMEEVVEAYFVIGEHNLIIKVSVPDLVSLEEFLIGKLNKIPSLEYSKSSIVTETIKDHYTLIQPGYSIKIQCHTCKKEIKGDVVKLKPYGHEFFFCCTSCASIFEKERERLLEPEVTTTREGEHLHHHK